MGFDNMRSSHARCPNYFLAALLLMCFLLTCNWWSLSSQNYELLRQMDEMGEQLKVCSDEKVICMSRKSTAESQIREVESHMADVKMSELKANDKLKKQSGDISNLKKTLEESKQSLTNCQMELESLKKVEASKTIMIDTLKLDKDTIVTQLNEAKRKIKDLENNMKTFKSTNPTKDSKTPANMLGLHITPSSPLQKSVQDAPQEVSINDGPVNNGNHESNYREIENVLENAANEDMDDDLVPKKF